MLDAIDPRWAWEPYKPSDKNPWDLKKVGHLYRRAAFGASWDELEAGLKAGPERAVSDLLKGGPDQEKFDADTAPLAQAFARGNNGQQLRGWWLYRMLYGPNPLREKLTLFWHNHFATSNAKVRNAGYMLGQYELMRENALGNFRTLLQEMSKNPAMMVWLDTNLSKKGTPNENYARELMELFSLGIGHYSEKDIRETARAFTGWEILGITGPDGGAARTGKATFNPAQHDDGEKTVLGQKGKWKGEDVVRICLEQKSCPYFIAGKLYRFLVSETAAPAKELLEPLATAFRKSDFDFGAMVETILRSNLFFSSHAYRARIKSPVDFALGTVRALEGHLPKPNKKERFGPPALAPLLENLGQNVFYPPSVKGWDGGQAWLNAQTLLFRHNLALALTSTEDNRFGQRSDPAALPAKYGKKTDEETVDFFLKLFFQDDVTKEVRAKLQRYQKDAQKQSVPVYWTEEDTDNHRTRALCHLVLTLPEYQLD